MVASQATLEEYFDDQEMMVIHRVHLEMEKARLDLENQQCYELVHGNELIVIEDTDSEGDGTEHHESRSLAITIYNPSKTNILLYAKTIYANNNNNNTYTNTNN